MNSKDLLSINEAFAKASSKVTADEPAKKDEVVTEDTEIVSEDALAVVKKKKDADEAPTEEKEDVVDETVEDDEATNNDLSNIMDEYAGRLSSSKFKIKEKATDQRPKDEVKADEVSKDVGETKKQLQKPVEADEKDDKKVKKEAKESINNSNKGNIMSEDKSIFDKLYEQVMGEDDEFGELGLPDDGLDVGDELGDEGGEDVTVTLTPDQADAIRAVADQLAPADEEPAGDEEPFADEEPEEGFSRESTDTVEEDHTPTAGAATSDGKKPGNDPSDGGGDATDPAPDSLGGKTGGTGDTNKDHGQTTGKATTDGKKPGVAKGSGKPGSLKANAKT